MDAVMAAIAGGMLAIIGTLVGVFAGRRGERERWRRDLQIELSTNALATLQRLIRATIDLAYVELAPRGEPAVVDTPAQREIRTAFEAAVTAPNAAMYAVLVGGDEVLSHSVRKLDREIDELTGTAFTRQWDRAAFRAERQRIGEMMAEHVNLARERAGLPRLIFVPYGAGPIHQRTVRGRNPGLHDRMCQPATWASRPTAGSSTTMTPRAPPAGRTPAGRSRGSLG